MRLGTRIIETGSRNFTARIQFPSHSDLNYGTRHDIQHAGVARAQSGIWAENSQVAYFHRNYSHYSYGSRMVWGHREYFHRASGHQFHCSIQRDHLHDRKLWIFPRLARLRGPSVSVPFHRPGGGIFQVVQGKKRQNIVPFGNAHDCFRRNRRPQFRTLRVQCRRKQRANGRELYRVVRVLLHGDLLHKVTLSNSYCLILHRVHFAKNSIFFRN